MSVYAISDLHLAISNPDKSMELFGDEWKDYLIHTPNRVLRRVLGSERYEALKQRIKRR